MSEPTHQAKFLTGDLMDHVRVMTLTATIGMVFVFVVDFVDLYFISLLGNTALTAALGFAGTLIFLNMSIGIGFMIAMSALAARSIGQGNPEKAKQIATNVMVAAILVSIATTGIYLIFAEELLALMGARGEALERGANYLRIVAASFPILACALVANGLLRAHGDAKRSMNATIMSGIVNAICDPIFIFALDLSLEGAAIASVLARIALAVGCFYPIFRHYGGFSTFSIAHFKIDIRPISKIAIPAILTNTATPVGAIILMRFIATYGEDAVAGYSVVSRLTPLAFCVFFTLSGAIGPIIGQNFGAGNIDRVKGTIRQSLIFSIYCAVIIWAVLIVGREFIATQFKLEAGGIDVFNAFIFFGAPLFYFNGMLFIANASLNNLNRPTWSTILNWARNTIGLFPFALVGSSMANAPGVVVGNGVGGIFFGIVAIYISFRLADYYASGKVKI